MQYYRLWMQKNIVVKLRTKIIHVLNGVTIDELNQAKHVAYYSGYILRDKDLYRYMESIKGCSKQEWIDRIYHEVCKVGKPN